MYAKTQIIIESRRYAGENSMALNISAIRIVADVMKNPMNARIHTPSTSAALTRFIPSSSPELVAPSNASSSSALGCFFRGYEEALNATCRLRSTCSTSSAKFVAGIQNASKSGKASAMGLRGFVDGASTVSEMPVCV